MTRPLVVTYGGTVEPIDDVRVITNLSRGSLGLAVVEHALARGARVHALIGRFSHEPPRHRRLHVERFGSAIDLGRRLAAALRAPAQPPGLAMLAAVADYRPKRRVRAKIRSDAPGLDLHLVANPKLVDRVQRWRKGARVVSFKLGGSATGQRALLELAEAQRQRTGSLAVVANYLPGRVHQAWWVAEDGVVRLDDRAAIARAVVAALLAE
ncbi:MAG TPA: phosphopantothenoylcysteine decarboxylase [Kofleriaceae bacterium]|nr:phosphopantothenoylcysteine decarboxylase [Kofleriaceae bacterium]